MLRKALLILVVIFISCTSDKKKNEYLIKVHEGFRDEIGVKTGYLNQKGDTIVALGKYYYCYTDTITNYGIVKKINGPYIAINRNDEYLYDVYEFDNGPDLVREGYFRIIIDKKIGYANTSGDIVIDPIYECAFPFNNGKARVSLNCETKKNGEYQMASSNSWIFINTKGEEIKK